MKVSNQSMKKLGFKRYEGDVFEHNVLASLRFSGRPEWEDVAYEIYEKGITMGHREFKEQIRRVLGIS